MKIKELEILLNTDYYGVPLTFIWHQNEYGILASDLAKSLGYVRKNGKVITDRMLTLVSPENIEYATIKNKGKKRVVIWEPGIKEVLEKTTKSESNIFTQNFALEILPQIEEKKSIIQFNKSLAEKDSLEVNSPTEKFTRPIIKVEQQKDQLVVDSRLIAEGLGIDHNVLVRNIHNHKETFVSSFGCLSFKNYTVEQPNGGSREYFLHYWLTEDQATFAITLSRNTPQVIECKVNLVKAFSEAKKKRENLANLRLGEVPTNLSESLRIAARAFIEAAEANEARELLEQKNKEIAEKYEKAEGELEVYRSITSPKTTFDMKKIADGLAIKGMGRNNLISYLRDKNFICKNGTAPYNTHVQNGLACVKQVTKYAGKNEITVSKTLITFKGLKWLIKNLKKDGYSLNIDAYQLYKNLT